MTFGERVKKIRLEKGLTQKELAEKCKIDPANLRKYESGRQNPKIETIEKISKVLQVSIQYLLGWSDEKQQEKKIVELDIKTNNMLRKYSHLNSTGQKKVEDYISDLCEINKYLNEDYIKQGRADLFESLNNIDYNTTPDEEKNPR